MRQRSEEKSFFFFVLPVVISKVSSDDNAWECVCNSFRFHFKCFRRRRSQDHDDYGREQIRDE